MKKYFSSFILLVAFTGLLHAQSAGDANDAASYPIGTPDNLVTVEEYWACLTDTQAPQKETSLEAVQENFIGDTIPFSVSGTPGACIFYIKTGLAEMLVSGVPTQAAQDNFNKWRQNPTSAELISYLDDQVKICKRTVSLAQISNCKQNAMVIKGRYPTATIFETADWVAQNYVTSKMYVFVTEANAAVVTIPGAQLPNLQQSYQSALNSKSTGQGPVLDIPDRPASIQIE